MKESQTELNKKSQRRRKKLGYAKFTRMYPVAFKHEIDAFIKEKNTEWEAIRDAE